MYGYFCKKIIKRSPEIAILVKKYENCDFGGSFDNFPYFLLIFFGEMGENSFGYYRKNYQKILEKREMSFCSSENKNWTFRESFCNFYSLSRFFGLFNNILQSWRK